MSSSIPSWQILTAHAQPFRRARNLAFCLKVPLDSLIIWVSSEGSGETARMRRLAWTFAARIGYKYQICLTRSIFACIQLSQCICCEIYELKIDLCFACKKEIAFKRFWLLTFLCKVMRLKNMIVSNRRHLGSRKVLIENSELDTILPQKNTYEPAHDKTNKLTCAPSKDYAGCTCHIVAFVMRQLIFIA